jgi:hypothetical protein
MFYVTEDFEEAALRKKPTNGSFQLLSSRGFGQSCQTFEHWFSRSRDRDLVTFGTDLVSSNGGLG